MSQGIELIDNKILKKFQRAGPKSDNESVHAHASRHLIEVYEDIDTGKKDDNGEPIFERRLFPLEALIAMSEINAPQGFTGLWEYTDWYEEAFPSRKGKSHLRHIPMRFTISMIGSQRKARLESVQVYSASAVNNQNPTDQQILDKVKES